MSIRSRLIVLVLSTVCFAHALVLQDESRGTKHARYVGTWFFGHKRGQNIGLSRNTDLLFENKELGHNKERQANVRDSERQESIANERKDVYLLDSIEKQNVANEQGNDQVLDSMKAVLIAVKQAKTDEMDVVEEEGHVKKDEENGSEDEGRSWCQCANVGCSCCVNRKILFKGENKNISACITLDCLLYADNYEVRFTINGYIMYQSLPDLADKISQCFSVWRKKNAKICFSIDKGANGTRCFSLKTQHEARGKMYGEKLLLGCVTFPTPDCAIGGTLI